MKYIKTVKELEESIRVFDGKPVLGSDTETEGLDPHTAELRLLQLSDKTNTLVIDVKKIGKKAVTHYVRPILESKDTVKIFHNAKFDLKFIKHHLEIDVERIFDTYLGSLLINAGLKSEKGQHSLGQVVSKFTNGSINKDEQLSDWSGELSEKQLKYAASDVECLIPVREAQIKRFIEDKLLAAAKIDFEAVLPAAWLELCGFYLDYDEWVEVAEKQYQSSFTLADEIAWELADVLEQRDLFGKPSINLNSPQQVYKAFVDYGIPMPENTKEFMLLPLVDRFPIIGKFLEYRGATKAKSSFGEGFKEFVNPVTGRIHADFFQSWASTGRFAPSNPNLNQIPSDNLHRNCFKAQVEGNTLLSADYSQEELRILADFSGDKNFIALFKTNEDFHKSTACTLFKKTMAEIDKTDRDLAKRMNFLLSYGGGAPKLSMSAGISIPEAKQVIKGYFNTFKGVDRWMRYQQQLVLKTRSARTASGKLMKFDFDEEDFFKRSKAQRNAVNSPIQGTGADILKRALRVFYDNVKDYRDKIKLVNIVHDEINLELPESLVPEVEPILKNSMIQAGAEFIKKVEVKVDTKVSRVWQKE